MNNSKTITLNSSEQAIAKSIANARYTNNRKNNVKDAKIGDQSAYETDLNGFGAELAFCKLINVYPDFGINPRSGGCDMVSKTGKRIDVKCTKYQDGHLLATLKKDQEDNIDIYVLMIGAFPTYRIAGWATREELFKPENIKKMKHTEGYALPQDKLNPWENYKSSRAKVPELN